MLTHYIVRLTPHHPIIAIIYICTFEGTGSLSLIILHSIDLLDSQRSNAIAEDWTILPIPALMIDCLFPNL